MLCKQDAVWRENGVEIEWYTEGDSEDGKRQEGRNGGMRDRKKERWYYVHT